MIDGEVRTIRFEIDGDGNFSATASIVAIKPNGIEYSPEPTVSVVPGGTANPQELRATFTWTAGVWRVTWHYTVNSETYLVPELYVVTWYDVVGDVRRLLQKSVTEVPDELIEWVLANLIYNLDLYYPTATNYRSLTGDDRFWTDQMLTFSAAVILKGHPTFANPSGALEMVRQGQLEYRFAKSTGFVTSVIENWLGSAYAALRNITEIGVIIRGKEGKRSIFQLAGPTRGVEAGLVSQLNHPLYALLKSSGALK